MSTGVTDVAIHRRTELLVIGIATALLAVAALLGAVRLESVNNDVSRQPASVSGGVHSNPYIAGYWRQVNGFLPYRDVAGYWRQVSSLAARPNLAGYWREVSGGHTR